MSILYYFVEPENSWTFSTTPSYDEDRYELIEKKDWKINNLKEKIKGVKEALENNKKSFKFYQDLITMNSERIEELNKELKELEKE